MDLLATFFETRIVDLNLTPKWALDHGVLTKNGSKQFRSEDTSKNALLQLVLCVIWCVRASN